ncbi:DNA-binding transcriptional LysR family regulator [Rhodococcus erythropolis]|uniref:LysR family transcriptional regulator n=1 Tax=Rhodococcus erythropolis TaxID=1833 RepID=UPI002168F8D9|nr:LysR family transcriptional regulator [Rhodococcus erythropolis]MCS4257827.1 DNA-binding transcriptional LysR family regulator [Rhodococcus erythropolis]MCW2425130.1 DNA-binding transcriptional LysR family regulator [Rhodococcus erythropolis]
MKEVDLNLLPHLHALLEMRNVSRAAERVHLSQSAMSAALARLRHHFDDELLVRQGREYVLTALAQSLAPAVQEALAKVHEAMQMQSAFDPSDTERTFVLAASDYATTVVMRPLRRLITSQAPRVSIDIVPIAGLDRGLDAFGSVDVIVGPMGYSFGGSYRQLFRDEFVAVMDTDNALLTKANLTLSDIASAPHATGEFGTGITTPPMQFLADAGLSPIVAARVSGWQVLPFLVEGTDLVALVPRLLASRLATGLSVTVVEFVRELEVPVVEAMYWHPLHSADPANTWLRSSIQQVCQEVRAEAGDVHPVLIGH